MMNNPAYVEKYDVLIKAMQIDLETMAASYSEVIRVTPTKILRWS